MSTRLPSESREQLMKRLDIERAELGREIRAGNYQRAATIASYISIQLTNFAQLVKETKP